MQSRSPELRKTLRSRGDRKRPSAPLLLIVDDSDDDRALMADYVGLVSNVEVRCVANGRDAERVMTEAKVGIAFVDQYLGDERGLDLVRLWRDRGLMLPVVLATSCPDESLKLQAMAGGVTWFLTKGAFSVEDVRGIVQNAAKSGFIVPD